MQQIKKDTRNYRRHTEAGNDLISQSLAECGAGRSILVDKDGNIVAGNQTFTEAQKLGIPIRIVETDGSELIAVQRTDLGTQDLKRKQLAVIDNKATDLSEFDIELLEQDLEDLQMEDFGFDIEDFGGSIEEEVSEEDAESDFPELKDEATVSKITFEFDPEMCVSILGRLENFRKSEELQTKEQVFLRMLEMSGI